MSDESLIDSVVGFITPWHLQPGSLNSREAEELARRRSMPMTITSQAPLGVNPKAVKAGKEGLPLSKGKTTGKLMDGATTLLSNLVDRYGDQVITVAENQLAKATNGNIRSPQAVPAYVGNDRSRAMVAVGALASAGIHPDHILPEDVVGQNPILAAIRQEAMNTFTRMQSQFNRGSDKTLQIAPSGIANDKIRRKRIEAVLAIYGTKEAYFLCHPNGGVPVEDFTWYDQVIRGR